MRPPSMTKSEPVTLPARSLASSTIRLATSSGRLNRPVTASAACLATSPAATSLARATVAAMPSSPSYSGVETGPWLTVLTRTLRWPTSLRFLAALPALSRLLVCLS